MIRSSVEPKPLIVAAVCGTAILAACQDRRLKQIDTGITRDSAVAVLRHNAPPGSPPDSFPNVSRRAQFTANGKTIEVLYFTTDNAKKPVQGGDTIPLRKLTPIVFLNDRMIGKGWDQWDSIAAANRIPVPPK